MDSELKRSHGEHYVVSPQHVGGSVVEEKEEQQHEKTSVLHKVKARARKIKDSLAKHGIGHDNSRDHEEEEEEDEEEDAAEETVERPVHGAPMHDSDAIKSDVTGHKADFVTPRESLERPSKIGAGGQAVGMEIPKSNLDKRSRSGDAGQEVDLGLPEGNSERTLRSGVDGQEMDLGLPKSNSKSPSGSGVDGQEVDLGVPKGNLERPSFRAEDRYDSDIKEPPVTPFAHWPEENSGTTAIEESQVQDDKPVPFPPNYGMNNPTHDTVNITPRGEEENFGEAKDKYEEQTDMEVDPHSQKDTSPFAPSNDETKVSDPIRKGGEEEGMTPILSSFNKMSVHDDPELKPETGSGSHDQFSPDTFPSSTTTNTQNPEAAPQRFDSSKTKDMFHDNLIEKPSNQNTYTDKAVLAKNAIASKLGYGGETPKDMPRDTLDEKPSNQSTYVETISSAAVSAKNVVASKLGYGGNVDSGSHETHPRETTAKSYGGEGNKGPEKSVSMKDYLAEKLKPGEEDKALSEVITGALHKPAAEETKPVEHRPKADVISDAFHKRHEEPENEEEVKKLEKVTVSDEVKRRLGGGSEDPKEGDEAAKIGAEQGTTVGWITGTVNSWLGRGADSPKSPDPHISGQGAQGHDQNLSEEGKLESSSK